MTCARGRFYFMQKRSRGKSIVHAANYMPPHQVIFKPHTKCGDLGAAYMQDTIVNARGSCKYHSLHADHAEWRKGARGRSSANLPSFPNWWKGSPLMSRIPSKRAQCGIHVISTPKLFLRTRIVRRCAYADTSRTSIVRRYAKVEMQDTPNVFGVRYVDSSLDNGWWYW